jgi:hypothetical protein
MGPSRRYDRSASASTIASTRACRTCPIKVLPMSPEISARGDSAKKRGSARSDIRKLPTDRLRNHVFHAASEWSLVLQGPRPCGSLYLRALSFGARRPATLAGRAFGLSVGDTDRTRRHWQTTLALRAARDVLEFAHGAWLVEFASLSDSNLVLSAVSGVLGLHLDRLSVRARPYTLGSAFTWGRTLLATPRKQCRQFLHRFTRHAEWCHSDDRLHAVELFLSLPA